MEYLVCKYKKDGRLFVTTRKVREAVIASFFLYDAIVDTIVVKEFHNYNEAVRYMKHTEEVDKLINSIIAR